MNLKIGIGRVIQALIAEKDPHIVKLNQESREIWRCAAGAKLLSALRLSPRRV